MYMRTLAGLEPKLLTRVRVAALTVTVVSRRAKRLMMRETAMVDNLSLNSRDRNTGSGDRTFYCRGMRRLLCVVIREKSMPT